MKIPQAKIDMLRMTVDFARDAIKLSAIGNGGGIIYMFAKNPPFPQYFALGSACFMAGFLLCTISAVLAYLSQREYGNAIKLNGNGTITIDESSNKIGDSKQCKALRFIWASIIIPAIGCVFVIMGCL